MGLTSIEWTERTWNPVKARLPEGLKLHQHKGLKILQPGTWGYHCERISPACENCYAEAGNKRTLPSWGTGLAYNRPNRHRVEIFLDPAVMREPLDSWRKPGHVFVCSMTDLFGDFVPESMIASVFETMDVTPQFTYQVLTKRPERMFAFMTGANRMGRRVWPPRNIWLGVSVESRDYLYRIDDLRKTPAAVRFLSLEPLLEDLGQLDLTGIHWVIVGGESGPDARPMHPDWVRSIQAQCAAAKVPFFFKQHGAWVSPANSSCPGGVRRRQVWLNRDGRTTVDDEQIFTNSGWVLMGEVGKKAAGRLLDGRTWDEMPEVAARA